MNLDTTGVWIDYIMGGNDHIDRLQTGPGRERSESWAGVSTITDITWKETESRGRNNSLFIFTFGDHAGERETANRSEWYAQPAHQTREEDTADERPKGRNRCLVLNISIRVSSHLGEKKLDT